MIINTRLVPTSKTILTWNLAEIIFVEFSKDGNFNETLPGLVKFRPYLGEGKDSENLTIASVKRNKFFFVAYYKSDTIIRFSKFGIWKSGTDEKSNFPDFEIHQNLESMKIEVSVGKYKLTGNKIKYNLPFVGNIDFDTILQRIRDLVI